MSQHGCSLVPKSRSTHNIDYWTASAFTCLMLSGLMPACGSERAALGVELLL